MFILEIVWDDLRGKYENPPPAHSYLAASDFFEDLHVEGMLL